MKRKAFKRNVQRQRQLRSVTYMRDNSRKAYQRREYLKNGAAGFVLGLVIFFILYWVP